jgi:hypothetical protein
LNEPVKRRQFTRAERRGKRKGERTGNSELSLILERRRGGEGSAKEKRKGRETMGDYRVDRNFYSIKKSSCPSC